MNGVTEAFPLPDFVLDYRGDPVRVGDTIVYGVLLGRSASLSISRVLAFQWQKSEYYSRREGQPPPLRIKVQGTEPHWRTGEMALKRPGLIDASLRRFILLEAQA